MGRKIRPDPLHGIGTFTCFHQHHKAVVSRLLPGGISRSSMRLLEHWLALGRWRRCHNKLWPTAEASPYLSFLKISKLHGFQTTHLHPRAPWVCTCRARGPSLPYEAPSVVLRLQNSGGQLAFFRQWKNGGNEDVGNQVRSVGFKANKMNTRL